MAAGGSWTTGKESPARRIPFGAAYDGTVGNSFPDNVIKTSKYTVPTFLPLNIYEQLQKSANVYFLVISLAMILGRNLNLFVTSVSSWSTLVPLVLMMALSAVIAAADDMRRHQSDARTNSQQARAIRMGGHFGVYLDTLAWACVNVGDVLVLKGEEEVPADMVPLACSGTDGVCYVSTANLDGETNLKVKYAAPAVQAALCSCGTGNAVQTNSPPLLNQAVDRFAALEGTVQAEVPTKSIHTFTGSVSLGASAATAGAEEGLSADHLLLRGTQLRNTAWCFGVVVYTGKDTRMVMNSRKAPMKLANLERIVNRTMLIVLGAQAALALLSDIGYVATKDRFQGYWYLFPDKGTGLTIRLPDIVGYWFTFFILYSNLMPISLYATMEVCNYAQAYFVKSDLEMYDEDQDCPALVRSTNLCHELGQVSYVFSDKTGTLTQNVMELKRVSIAGEIFGTLDERKPGFHGGAELETACRRSPQVASAVDAFMEVLAVSHTVMVTQDQRGVVRYEAESPDEGALVEAVRGLGWDFSKRTGQMMTVAVKDSATGETRECMYRLLALNAFTSARKRMSVVVETPSGELMLLAKGADNAMMEVAGPPGTQEQSAGPGQAWPEPSALGSDAGRVKQDHARLQNHLSTFAQDGLRTLVLGRRRISREEFAEWYRQYEEAHGALQDRVPLLEAAAESIEVQLEVLGATAIEDRLQVGVAETIVRLRQAGVRLWVLTGDKLETARNIGFSTRVLSTEMDIMVLDGITVPAAAVDADATGADGTASEATADSKGGNKELTKALEEALCELRERVQKAARGGYEAALMVTGRALEQLADAGTLRGHFLEVATSCKVLIACRVSPLQKSQMVRLVRKGTHPPPVTLAIGDGANDVPMIQEAQVGVGISGREGRQAVNASDFAIAQFRYLQRLLLVHGRWDYRRMCKFVLYSFWKNAVLVLLLFYYSFISGHSGTAMFNSQMWTFFNVILCLPVIATGIFDRDVLDSEALANPNLYETGRLGLDLNLIKMIEMLLSAMVHSLIILLVMLFAFSRMFSADFSDYYSFGTIVYTWLIIAMNYRVIFITTTMNWMFAATVASSFLLYLLFMVFLCMNQRLDPFMYMVVFHVAASPLFWIGSLAVPALAMMIDVFKAYLLLEFLPDHRDLVLEAAKDGEFSEGGPAIDYREPFPPSCYSFSVRSSVSGTSVLSETESANGRTSFAIDHTESHWRQDYLTSHRHAFAGDTSLMDHLPSRGSSPHDRSFLEADAQEAGAQPAAGGLRRPSCTAFAQQKLPSFTFVLSWRGVLAAALLVGTLLMALGIGVYAFSLRVDKIHVQYDGERDSRQWGTRPQEWYYFRCPVHADGQTNSCLFNVTVQEDMQPPIFVIYNIIPFYQNYNSYLKSVIFEELQGKPMDEATRADVCESRMSRETAAGERIYPCGLIATSVFNDTFEVTDVPIDTEDPFIAWGTDYRRFANPPDWRSWSNVSWLYERYPGVTTEALGVKSRRFVSWMLPDFFGRVHNTYGVIKTGLRAGQTLGLRVNASFPVSSLGARKEVALMTRGLLGGRNYELAVLLMVSGVACYFMAVVIFAIHHFCARQPGRPRTSPACCACTPLSRTCHGAEGGSSSLEEEDSRSSLDLEESRTSDETGGCR